MLRSIVTALAICFPLTTQAGALMSPSGKPLAWAQNTEFVVEVAEASASLEQQALVERLRAAFSAWTQETSSAPRVKVITSLDPTVANSSRVHRVSVVNEDWLADDDTLAVTTYTFKKSTGEITDADIAINGTGPCMTFDDTVSQRCYDARAILLHEVGHFLGLDHASHTDAAIMYPTLSPGDDSKRALDESDVEELRGVYPSQPGAAVSTAAAAGFTTTNSGVARTGCSAQEPSAVALLIIATLLVLRRRNTNTRWSLQ